MSFQPGDTVHVEFDAELINSGSRNALVQFYKENTTYETFVPVDACTKIAPKVAVGDKLSAENMDYFPEGSYATCSSNFPVMRYNGAWYFYDGIMASSFHNSSYVVERIGWYPKNNDNSD